MSDEMLYREMSAALALYEDGKLGFRSLLDRLEKCVDQISSDPLWQDDFRPVWGRMEDAYAYASAMGWKQIPGDRMPAVLAALAEAKHMVLTKLKSVGR
jgi:hypothetical protein